MLPVLVGVAVPVLGIAAILAGTRRPSRITLTVADDLLHVKISGKDALYALNRGMVIPVRSVKGVCVAPRHLVPQTGLRLPGTGIPGVLRAGSFGTGATRDFWLVRQAPQVLVIELEPGEPYRRLVLEVPDPQAEAQRLRPALGFFTGSFSS